VLVLAGAACGGGDDGASSTAAPASTTLQGPVWQWQGSQYNNDTKATPDDPSRYTIRFADDGTVSIRADCNQVGGTFEADQGSLTITLGPSTLKACPEDSLDSEYLRDLQGAAGYLFGDAGQLHIDIKFDTGTMTFASAPS
jgi:heat shock protein HslJ